MTEEDSRRLIREKGYDVAGDTPLAIMVISDRISAFDCIWHGEGGLNGVPGKGAALNAISNHWFKLFKEQGLADSHILISPPAGLDCSDGSPRKKKQSVVNISQAPCGVRTKRVSVTSGIDLPEGLEKNQKLPSC